MEKLFRTLHVGIKSLWLHKLRSILTILGIFIGVTAVVWLVAMGEGVSYQAQQQIKELGATNIIIRSIKPPQTSSRTGNLTFVEYGLLRADYDRIVETIPTITRAVPMREVPREVRYRDRTIDVKLVGCTRAYLDINNLQMARGRFVSDRDVDRVDNVAVLAYDTAQQLFPFEDPIGKAVQIDADFYTIIGKTASRTPSAAIGGSLEARDYNLDVYIPLSTLRARIGDMVNTSRSGGLEGEVVQLSQITVSVSDLSEVDEAEGSIKTLLEKFHKDPDFAVVVPKELLRQAEVLRMMFNVLLVLIAGISLVVGGIGIMNIMLATVTERTKEIGIRRALGAKRRDIIEQFLTETVALSGTGGLLGAGVGVLCPYVVGGVQWLLEKAVPEVMSSLPPNIQTLEPLVAPWSIVVAFGISVVVGLVFGLYPARRAALMDPIEALRHE